jgi:undecaprenyl-diphosphatase
LKESTLLIDFLLSVRRNSLSWWLAAAMGVVQGVTEFLPISSSAHLRILPALVGQKDPGASFTAVIQIGTIFSVLIYFKNDLISISKATLIGIFRKNQRNKDFKMGLSIILATLPIIFLGFFGQDFIKNGARDLYLVAYVMLIFSFVMFFVDKYSKFDTDINELSRFRILMLGFAQSLALIPGFSRSGVTITAARFFGINRSDAARFSFLLSVPAIVLSGLYEAIGITNSNESGWGQTIFAAAVSFVVGYLSIAWLIKWLGNHSLKTFVIYRIALSLVIIALLNGGIISNV